MSVSTEDLGSNGLLTRPSLSKWDRTLKVGTLKIARDDGI
jgi:hypothetical protein